MPTAKPLLNTARNAVALACFVGLGMSAAALALPLFVIHLFESGTLFASGLALGNMALAVIAVLAGVALLQLARDTILLRASLWLEHELGQVLLHLGLQYMRPASDMRGDIDSLQRIASFLRATSSRRIFDLAGLPVAVLFIAFINPVLAGAAALPFLLLATAQYSAWRSTRHLRARQAQEQANALHWWTALARDASRLGSGASASAAARQWDMIDRAHISTAYITGKKDNAAAAVVRFIELAGLAGFFLAAAFISAQGAVTPGVLLACALVFAQAMHSSAGMSSHVTAITGVLADTRRLRAIRFRASAAEAAASRPAQSGVTASNAA